MTQVPFPEHDDMVEALPADRANQALRIILPGGTRRYRMIANAQYSNAAGEYASVAGIPVSDQIAGCMLPAAGFRELDVP
jgi:hypothetical protein